MNVAPVKPVLVEAPEIAPVFNASKALPQSVGSVIVHISPQAQALAYQGPNPVKDAAGPLNQRSGDLFGRATNRIHDAIHNQARITTGSAIPKPETVPPPHLLPELDPQQAQIRKTVGQNAAKVQIAANTPNQTMAASVTRALGAFFKSFSPPTPRQAPVDKPAETGLPPKRAEVVGRYVDRYV